MPSPDLRGLFKIGLDVLSTTVNKTTRAITAQLGNVVGQTVDSDGAGWWQHVGFVSRPSKAEPGKRAAQTVTINAGDRDHVIASRDLRGQELYAELADGESGVYAAGEDGNAQARALFKKDGSIHLYTRKGNTKDGAGMTVQIDAMGGAIRLINDKGFGLIIDADGITLTSGEGALELKANGDVSLIGKGKCQFDGTSIIAGSNPAAVPGLMSALRGATGLIGTASSKFIIAD